VRAFLFLGGQRNWCQVISNGAMAAQLALLYLMDVGVGERPIDYIGDYRPSYLGMAVLGENLTITHFSVW
jgi:hypothetical protein